MMFGLTLGESIVIVVVVIAASILSFYGPDHSDPGDGY